jgi:hypothetical protein
VASAAHQAFTVLIEDLAVAQRFRVVGAVDPGATAIRGPLRHGPSPGDFLRARDNPGYRVTWANARKRLLTCAIG